MSKKFRVEDGLPKLVLIVCGLAYLVLYSIFNDFKTAGTVLIAVCVVIAALVLTTLMIVFLVRKRANVRTDPGPIPERPSSPPVIVPPPIRSIPRYDERQFLTETELYFFRDLHRAVIHPLLVQCKVGLWAVARETDSSGWNQISQKQIDFVIYDPTRNKVLLAIELDDYSHQSPKAQARDAAKNAILHQAGIPLVRVQVGKEYDFNRILSDVQTAQKKSRATV